MEWRPVKGYEGYYEVSENGDVRSVDREYYVESINQNRKKKGVVLKQQTSNTGYKTAHLSKDGDAKVCLVHRIVANAFLDNHDNLPQVNHKDGNRLNNRVDNLEWCSASYNSKYNYDILGKSWESRRKSCEYTFKPVAAKNIKTGEVVEFKCVNECARYFGLSKSSIRNRLSGKINNPSTGSKSKVNDWYFYEIKNEAEQPEVIVQFDLDYKYVNEFKNPSQAAIFTGVSPYSISNLINHKNSLNTAGGYIWMFKSEAEARGLLDL